MNCAQHVGNLMDPDDSSAHAVAQDQGIPLLSPAGRPIIHLGYQKLNLPARYERRVAERDGCPYYADHELRSTSMFHPVLLARFVKNNITGYDAFVIDTAESGAEFLIDCNKADWNKIGPWIYPIKEE